MATVIPRFWTAISGASVDQGDPSAATPLFTGIYEGYPLSQVVANRFGLQLHEAESAIDIARKEVAL